MTVGEQVEHAAFGAGEVERLQGDKVTVRFFRDGQTRVLQARFLTARAAAEPAPKTADAGELMAAIRAAPDDDGPRLVYADHLTEQGDRRGELIVLQCRRADEARQREILEADVLPRLRQPFAKAEDFERGFLRVGWLSGGAWVEAIDHLERELLERLTLYAPRPELAARVASSSWFAFLRELEIEPEVSGAILRALAPTARDLRSLYLHGRLDADALAALAGWRVRHLALRAGGLQPADLAALAPLRSLESLVFYEGYSMRDAETDRAGRLATELLKWIDQAGRLSGLSLDRELAQRMEGELATRGWKRGPMKSVPESWRKDTRSFHRTTEAS